MTRSTCRVAGAAGSIPVIALHQRVGLHLPGGAGVAGSPGRARGDVEGADDGGEVLLADHRGDPGGAVAQHPAGDLPVSAGLEPASGRSLVVEAERDRPGPVAQSRVTQPLEPRRDPAEVDIGGPPVLTAQVLGLGGDDHRPALGQVADRERGVGGGQVGEQGPGQPQVPAARVRGLPASQRDLGPDAHLVGTSTLAGEPDRQRA